MANEIIFFDNASRQKIPRLGRNNRYTIFSGNATTILSAGGGFPTFNIETEGSGNFYNGGNPEQMVSRIEAPIFTSVYIYGVFAAQPTTSDIQFSLIHSTGAVTIAGQRLYSLAIGGTVIEFVMSGGIYSLKDAYTYISVLNNTDQDVDITARAIIYTLT